MIYFLKVFVLFAAFSLTACFGYDPIPKSKCPAVVKHVAKVLGDKSPSKSEMMKKCKAATDEQRGCALAASKPLAISNCKL